MDLSKLVKENISEHNQLFNNFEDKLILDIVKAGKLIADGLAKKQPFFGAVMAVVHQMLNTLMLNLLEGLKKQKTP